MTFAILKEKQQEEAFLYGNVTIEVFGGVEDIKDVKELEKQALLSRSVQSNQGELFLLFLCNNSYFS